MSGYRLYGTTGWGSALVEAQLTWYGLPFDTENVGNLFTSEEARARLSGINPLAQVPTLVLPDGTVMTESVAITLLLADGGNARSLVPSAGDALRPQFLRWLVFLVANVYPTFTYADDPARFVADEASRPEFATRVNAYRERLWLMVESAAGAPWFCGNVMTALDVFVCVMTRWTPRRAWFAANCPRLSAIADRTDAVPEFASVWRRNFPEA